MAHPYHHALSSKKKWGGAVEDYLAIHTWFDASKEIIADFRHRALRHHAEGIFMAETIFGVTITLSSGRIIPHAGLASSMSPKISASSRVLPTGLGRSSRHHGWDAPRKSISILIS